MGAPIVDDFESATRSAVWGASTGTPTQTAGAMVVDGSDVLIASSPVDLSAGRQFFDVEAVSSVPGVEDVIEMRSGSSALRWRFRPNAAGAATLFGEVVVGSQVSLVTSTPFSASTRVVAFRAQAGRLYFDVGPSLARLAPVEPAGRVPELPLGALQVRAFERPALGSVQLDVDGAPYFDPAAAGPGAVVRDVDGVPALDPVASSGIAVVADVDGTPTLTA